MAELPNPFLKYKIVLKEDYLHNNALVYFLVPIVQVVMEFASQCLLYSYLSKKESVII